MLYNLNIWLVHLCSLKFSSINKWAPNKCLIMPLKVPLLFLMLWLAIYSLYYVCGWQCRIRKKISKFNFNFEIFHSIYCKIIQKNLFFFFRSLKWCTFCFWDFFRETIVYISEWKRFWWCWKKNKTPSSKNITIISEKNSTTMSKTYTVLENEAIC